MVNAENEFEQRASLKLFAFMYFRLTKFRCIHRKMPILSGPAPVVWKEELINIWVIASQWLLKKHNFKIEKNKYYQRFLEVSDYQIVMQGSKKTRFSHTYLRKRKFFGRDLEWRNPVSNYGVRRIWKPRWILFNFLIEQFESFGLSVF